MGIAIAKGVLKTLGIKWVAEKTYSITATASKLTKAKADALAKELKVPVLALSPLNREVESRKGGMPQLSDLRESGSIEQDADIVLFIHHPYKYAEAKEIAEGKVRQNVAEIKVAKNRSGPMGVVQLYFKGESTKFINLKEDGEPDDDSITTNAKVKGYEELPAAGNVNSDKEVNPDSEIF